MIIGLGGKKQSGKNFAAQLIQQHIYSNFIQRAFADPMKRAICDAFQLKDFDEYDKFKQGHIEFVDKIVLNRHITRSVGMTMVEAQPNLFVDYIKNEYQRHPHLIITDVRRRREIDFIKQYDHILIYIHKDGDLSDNHITENEVSSLDFDHIIDNNYTTESANSTSNLLIQLKEILIK